MSYNCGEKIFLVSTHLNINELHFHTKVFFFHTFPQIDPFEVIFLHPPARTPPGRTPKIGFEPPSDFGIFWKWTKRPKRPKRPFTYLKPHF